MQFGKQSTTSLLGRICAIMPMHACFIEADEPTPPSHVSMSLRCVDSILFLQNSVCVVFITATCDIHLLSNQPAINYGIVRTRRLLL
jgi:hypothetical protein